MVSWLGQWRSDNCVYYDESLYLLRTWATFIECRIYITFQGNYSYSWNTPREGGIGRTLAQHDDLDHTGSLTQERLDFLDHFSPADKSSTPDVPAAQVF